MNIQNILIFLLTFKKFFYMMLNNIPKTLKMINKFEDILTGIN